MGRTSFLIFVFLLLGGGSLHAGTLAQCNTGAKQAEDACKAAEAAARAADGARSAATGAASGNDINQNCSNMGRDIGQQQGNLSGAQAKCQTALAKCASSCTPNPDPIKGPIENPQIETRKGQCQTTISGQLGQLAQALGNLAQNAQQAAACKGQSDGKPPQMPQMPQQQDKPKDEKQALICDSEDGARYSDCNSHFLAKCMNNMTATGCETFSNRYCGNATVGGSISTGSAAGGANDGRASGGIQIQSTFRTASASLVTDKSGEGLGSGFCKMVTAYKFCQSVGRTECPSCRGMYAYSTAACQSDPTKCTPTTSTDALKAAKNTCPMDPIFLDPAIVKAIQENANEKNENAPGAPPKTAINPDKTAGTPVAGYGTGGGGFGSPGAAGGDSIIGMDGATPESLPGGNANAVGSGSGASSNSYSGVSDEDEDSSDRQPSAMGDGVLPAGAIEGMPARDVSYQYGPNIFSIQSTIYRSMCAAEKLSTCVRKKK